MLSKQVADLESRLGRPIKLKEFLELALTGVPEDTRKRLTSRLTKLQESSDLLNYLEAAGIDSMEVYRFALKLRDEDNKESL